MFIRRFRRSIRTSFLRIIQSHSLNKPRARFEPGTIFGSLYYATIEGSRLQRVSDSSWNRGVGGCLKMVCRGGHCDIISRPSTIQSELFTLLFQTTNKYSLNRNVLILQIEKHRWQVQYNHGINHYLKLRRRSVRSSIFFVILFI